MRCDELRLPKRAARVHPKQQIVQLTKSLSTYDQVLPILVDDKNRVVDGVALLMAARDLGWDEVLVLRTSQMSEGRIRALRLSLNKTFDESEWNVDELKLELHEILYEDPDIVIDLPGFETAELDLLLVDTDGQRQVDEDDLIPNAQFEVRPISRTGDLWRLGDHYLITGDALDLKTFEALLGDQVVKMVNTDPPFNVRIKGHVSGLGATQHREFIQASGEMSAKEFEEFLSRFLINCTKHCDDGAVLHVVMDWRHQPELHRAAERAGLNQISLCVWVKTNAGMGSLYRSQHELVHIFKSGSAPHINNIELGRFGRNRTNVWTYAGMNTFHEERDDLLAAHPTVKPVAMIADAICDSTNRGDVVLDPFAGSGTIFLAAERTGRRAYGIELDPVYCDVAMDRWEQKTGQKAIHAGTGLTRKGLAERRTRRRKRTAPIRNARSTKE